MKSQYRVIGLCLCGLLVLLASSCGMLVSVWGNGITSEETRLSGASFTGVSSSGIADVAIVQDVVLAPRVIISADSNLQQYLTAEVSGGTLYLGVEPGVSISPSATIRIVVYAPLVSRVESSGTGNLAAQGLTASQILSIRESGTGNVTLTGAAASLSLDSTGTGDVDAGGFIATNVVLGLSGVGNCRVNAIGTISGYLSGIGDLRYNSGAVCVVSRSGLGRIIAY